MKSWWKHLRREIEEQRELEFAMLTLLEKLAPAAQLEGLAWNADAERLRWWLFENLEECPPPENADQFWFRLFTQEWRDRIDSCDLELAGGEESDRFDIPLQEVTWKPSNPLLGSVVLPRLAREGTPQLCLAYSVLAIQSALFGIDEAMVLGSAHSRGISVGFEEGPGVYLGRFDGAEWDRDELCHY